MNTQISTLFCLCIVIIIPLFVFSTSVQELKEELYNDVDNNLERFAKSVSSYRQPYDSKYVKNHAQLKKAVDFEQILKPCNQMPASGRGNEYSDCVRSRMLLLGRRKRQATY